MDAERMASRTALAKLEARSLREERREGIEAMLPYRLSTWQKPHHRRTPGRAI
jgi:hypothetical protein